MKNQSRIQALFSSLFVLAAELGPLFIHSPHGQAVFTQTFDAAALLAGPVEELVTGETVPRNVTSIK